MRNRRIALAIIVLALVVAATRHPTANIQITTRTVADPAVQRVEAALDVGVFAVSVIVNWTGKRLTSGR